MIEQLNNSIKFLAFFVASKIGKPTLTVTIDVYNPAGTLVVNGGSATALGGGLYQYILASGSVTTEGEYLAIFKTSDTTVDQQHIPALWVIGRAGVEDLDTTITSRADSASYTPARAAKLDYLDVSVNSRSSHTPAQAAQAVWDYLTSAGTVVGSYGKRILDFFAGLTYTAPDNTSITSIKGKTDQLNFTGTDVKATLDGEKVTVVANEDKLGYTLATPPPTVAQIDTQLSNSHGSGSWVDSGAPDNTAITAIKNKTDQLLFSVSGDVKATLDGEQVAVATNADKTGYSLAMPPPTAAQIDTQLTTSHGSGSWVDSGAADNASIADIKAQTDKFVFAGSDVQVTLAGEKVTVATNEDKGGYSLATPPLAADDYVAPDNAGIASIQSQTDQFSFNVDGDVLATLDGESVSFAQSAAAIAAITSGAKLTIHRGDAIVVTLTGLGDLTNRSKLWWTIKRSTDDIDAAAVVQLEETAGLLTLNGSSTGFAVDGAVLNVTDESTGNVTITLSPTISSQLPARNGNVYDLQVLRNDGTTQTLTRSTVAIVADVTRRII